MASLTAATLACVNTAVALQFLHRIAAPSWVLQAGTKQRTFSPKSPDVSAWIIEQQRAGTSVATVLPTFEGGGVWHLIARLPLTASPAALKPQPSSIIMADDFLCLWRLAAPVTRDKATALVSRIIGARGKAATGEPVLLPGTVHTRPAGPMRVQRFPVRIIPGSPTPGYSVQPNGTLIDVRKKPSTALVIAPGTLVVPLAPGMDWVPGMQTNGFLLVLGSSGSGKTETLKTTAAPVHRFGVPVVVLDFHGDVKVPGVPMVRLSSDDADVTGLNPLARDPAVSEYDHRLTVAEMIARAVPGIGHRQRNALAEALDASPATFGELLATLDDPGLIAAVRGLFSHPIFNRAANVAVGAKSLHLDMSMLTAGVRYVAAETLLQRLFTAMRMRGPIDVKPANDRERFRLCIVIDEALIITGQKSDIIGAMFREARKYGLMMIVAGQSADHFSADIRGQAASWLVLKPMTVTEAKANAGNIGVTPDDLMGLRGKGDGYFRSGGRTAVRVQVRPVG